MSKTVDSILSSYPGAHEVPQGANGLFWEQDGPHMPLIVDDDEPTCHSLISFPLKAWAEGLKKKRQFFLN